MVLDRLLGSKEASQPEKLLYFVEAVGTDGVLRGRKKLTKLLFFAEHWLPEEGLLRAEPGFGGFDFAIYRNGPFSKELFAVFDDLKAGGLVEETRRPRKPSRISVTPAGEDRLRDIEDALDRGELAQVEAVRDRFADVSGSELEARCWEALGIEPTERREYLGMPVSVMVSEKR